ncbi:uncharacterized protein LOC120516777 isoform X2 [Polypterus senegalus]|uniref:uncharacterized protein LOC120516777 isoform X2 n=1 Tax=Polypterus senegalus TaxID=55291 RepID=UPI001966CD37|nr:uncharacterized protein LOC120516777 isoform X2 [Polypterus senegalus]
MSSHSHSFSGSPGRPSWKRQSIRSFIATLGPSMKLCSDDSLEDSLEDLLTYDDLFLQYFNTFLALPVFPIRLHYERLTGLLHELDGLLPELSVPAEQDTPSPSYGATDSEREKVLEWLQAERLRGFLSRLFVEYKLAKLLLRPLDHLRPPSPQGLRGYSRQSNGTTALSLSSRKSNGELSRESSQLEVRLSDSHFNGGTFSRTHSLPDTFGRCHKASGVWTVGSRGPMSLASSQSLQTTSFTDGVTSLPPSLISSSEFGKASVKTLDDKNSLRNVKRQWSEARSAVEDKPDGLKILNRITVFLQSSHFTASEEKDMETKESAECTTSQGLQQLKETCLGSKAGMDEFRKFLEGTAGIHLYNFWLDCELINEWMANPDRKGRFLDVQCSPGQLLRDSQKKCRWSIGREQQEQIWHTQGGEVMADVFRQVQYDVLRRLRFYWVTRFLVHKKRVGLGRARPTSEQSLRVAPPITAHLFLSGQLSERPEEGPEDISKTRKELTSKRTSTRCESFSPGTSFFLSTSVTDKLLTGIECDKEAGGTFLYYLSRFDEPPVVHCLLLWQELLSLGEVKLLPLATAWRLFGKYLSATAPCSIGIYTESPSYIHAVHQTLTSSRGFVEVTLLNPAARYALETLREAWISYLHSDIVSFVEHCIPSSAFQSPKSPSAANPNEALPRLRRKPRKSMGLDKKRTNAKRVHFELQAQLPSRDPPDGHSRDPPSLSALHEIKSIFNAYKRIVEETESAEVRKTLELWQEFVTLPRGGRDRTYLDVMKRLLKERVCNEGQEQAGSLPKHLRKQVLEEVQSGCVKAATVDHIQGFLGSLLKDSVRSFWCSLLAELRQSGPDPSQLTSQNLSSVEPLVLKLASKVIVKCVKSNKARGAAGGYAQPTQDNMTSLVQALDSASEGWPTTKVLHFYRHLQTHGPSEGYPLLENNLLFYLEVQKFKRAHHENPDEGLLKKKVHILLDCFLTSQLHPSLQIAINEDIYAKTLQEAQQYLSGLQTSPSIFDDAQNHISVLLLPHWMRFLRVWEKLSARSSSKAPEQRIQQLLKKRMALHLNSGQPQKTFHLPLICQAREDKQGKTGVTYSFSVSQGIRIKRQTRDLSMSSDFSSPSPTEDTLAMFPPIGSKTQTSSLDF